MRDNSEKERRACVLQDAADLANLRWGRKPRRSQPANSVPIGGTLAGHFQIVVPTRRGPFEAPQDEAPPERLYKYLPREFAETLTKVGSTRVGTLHDFRNIEKHAKGIADESEGKRTVTAHFENETIVGGSERYKALKSTRAVNIPDNVGLNVGKLDIVMDYDHADALVWCCSTEKSIDAMKEVGGADTCVEIIDVPSFFSALNDAVRTLHPVLLFQGPATVLYQDRKQEWREDSVGISPAFIKGLAFGGQGEVRVAWVTPEGADQLFDAFILAASECHQYCRIVDLAGG